MTTKKPYKLFAIAVLFLLLYNSAGAQMRISSPYSYYGLGEIQTNRSAYHTSMGGISIATRNPVYINSANPASYTALDTNSFVFDLGVTSNFNQLQSSAVTQDFTNHTSLSYLLFGFPVARWCGVSAGILPYSRTGYRIIIRDTIQNIGQVTEKFEGSGGINQAYFGTGFRIFKNLSIGVNVGYLFGTTYKSSSVYTPDLSFSYNVRVKDETRVSNFYFNYGMQYQIDLKKKYNLIVGTKFNLPMKLNAKRDLLAERFTASGDIESIKDTLLENINEKGKINMPFMIGGGITFLHKNHWQAGIDLDWQNWTKYRSFDTPDSIKNSFNIAAGGEITPRYTANKYWKRMSYRIGFHYGQTYLNLHGTRINDFGVGLGIGFPVPKIKTIISLAMEAGKKGTIQDNLVQENYIKLTLGFSFREFWFYRPKLN